MWVAAWLPFRFLYSLGVDPVLAQLLLVSLSAPALWTPPLVPQNHFRSLSDLCVPRPASPVVRGSAGGKGPRCPHPWECRKPGVLPRVGQDSQGHLRLCPHHRRARVQSTLRALEWM